MRDIVIQLLLKVLGELITPELVKDLEAQALAFVRAKVDEFVASTPTQYDDKVWEIIEKALGLKA